MKQRLLVAAVGVPLLIVVLVFLPPIAATFNTAYSPLTASANTGEAAASSFAEGSSLFMRANPPFHSAMPETRFRHEFAYM